MPFKDILWRTVRSVSGAKGAVFMDGDCEYVQYVGIIDSFREKLMGAYQGILLGMARDRLAQPMKLGGVDKLAAEYANAYFITKVLRSGYFLVLIMDPGANLGQAFRQLDRAAGRINEEIV